MARPPKPFRLSGSNLIMVDIYTTGTATAGAMLVDAPVLSYLNVPAEMHAVSSSRAFKQGANTHDTLHDLLLAKKTAGGVVLDVQPGWRFLDEGGVRYHAMGAGIDTGDGRQRVTVRRVRS